MTMRCVASYRNVFVHARESWIGRHALHLTLLRLQYGLLQVKLTCYQGFAKAKYDLLWRRVPTV